MLIVTWSPTIKMWKKKKQNRAATFLVMEKNHENAKGRIWKRGKVGRKKRVGRKGKREKAKEREEQKDVKSKYYFNIFI